VSKVVGESSLGTQRCCVGDTFELVQSSENSLLEVQHFEHWALEERCSVICSVQDELDGLVSYVEMQQRFLLEPHPNWSLLLRLGIQQQRLASFCNPWQYGLTSGK